MSQIGGLTARHEWVTCHTKFKETELLMDSHIPAPGLEVVLEVVHLESYWSPIGD